MVKLRDFQQIGISKRWFKTSEKVINIPGGLGI